MASHPSPQAETPLSIEPVIGWRVWSLMAGSDGEVALASPMQHLVWTPMEPSRATCGAGRRHRVPDPACMCGLYAAAWPARLLHAVVPVAFNGCAVIGSVSLWGRIVEHAAGYRATFGYPDRVRLVCGSCLGMGRAGVPTRVFRVSGDHLVPLCSVHGPSAAARESPMSPDDLERELLSKYAVDLLPLEVLHEAGFAPGSARSVGGGLVEEAKAEWHDLVRSWAGRLGALALVLMFLWVGRSEFLVSLPAPVAAPSVTPVPTLSGSGDPPRTEALEPADGEGALGAKRSRLLLTFLCGRRVGDDVRLVDCMRGAGSLSGFISVPPTPRRKCEPANAYTRKQMFSVCWIDFDTFKERRRLPPEVLELPGVHWRDLLGDER